MGKRKSSSSKQRPKKKQEKLDTVFNCPFCSHSASVDCQMDRKEMIGELKCRICEANYSMKINNLSEPIDVFSEWVDECEKANYGIGDGNA